MYCGYRWVNAKDKLHLNMYSHTIPSEGQRKLHHKIHTVPRHNPAYQIIIHEAQKMIIFLSYNKTSGILSSLSIIVTTKKKILNSNARLITELGGKFFRQFMLLHTFTMTVPCNVWINRCATIQGEGWGWSSSPSFTVWTILLCWWKQRKNLCHLLVTTISVNQGIPIGHAMLHYTLLTFYGMVISVD